MKQKIEGWKIPRKVSVLIFSFCLSLFLGLLPSANLPAAEPNYNNYDKILKTYISTKTVDKTTSQEIDYEGIAKDPLWPTVIAEIENFDLELLKNKFERLAFFINAYNIHVLQVVIAKKPAKSIKDISNVFSEENIKIGQQSFSLDKIEEELRKLGDGRFHFTIFRAAMGSPDLADRAYRAATLTAQLYQATALFIMNPLKGSFFDKESNTIKASQIFSWYQEDFKGPDGVKKMILHYGKHLPKDANFRTSKFDFGLAFDWTLQYRHM